MQTSALLELQRARSLLLRCLLLQLLRLLLLLLHGRLLLPLHSLMMQELLLRPLCICPRALLD